MNDVILYVVLIIMIAFAIFTVLSDDLFRAVIYAGVLSFFAAFLFVLLGAPDVALAEAVIGATIVTAIFLVTLKNYKTFNIYLIGGGKELYSMEILGKIAKAFRERGMEVHMLQMDREPEELLGYHNCDLVVEKRENVVLIHGEDGSQYLKDLSQILAEELEREQVVIEEN